MRPGKSVLTAITSDQKDTVPMAGTRYTQKCNHRVDIQAGGDSDGVTINSTISADTIVASMLIIIEQCEAVSFL